MKLIKSALVSSLMAAASFGACAQTTINGAGSTFAYPIYTKWAKEYAKDTNVQINYQGVGSGAGIRAIESKTVDFGATDAPLTAAQLKEKHLVQWPAVMGATVMAINVPGIKPGELRLSGPVIADIYLGKIKKWNDPAIVALNKEAIKKGEFKLPNHTIYVVHRSDGSGTTFNFTEYLDQVSPTWHKKIGFAKSVSWPKEAINLGGKGNAGVANDVTRTPYSIGYVEYAYAKETGLTYTAMKNRDGKYLEPSMKTFQAAASNADWKHAPGYYLLLNNQPGAESWPMTAATFILVQKDPKNPERTKDVIKFYNWAYSEGSKAAESLSYVPMPQNLINMVRKTWQNDITHDGKQVITAKTLASTK
ncbi:phosphate ABC transporter substrate-binding protein PstS [Vibrio sp. S4M6]|uniref:phosphate ABC transporter substrate-binding protein PstS n=1 Tax=Vibrio sinus TaxID=2946865 RepID=UPI00202A991D|nr:phosphate ABC transporter substrate-binding protein PstS [Vibrio sinus]